MKGVFITLEGVDGCGKSTQLALLDKTLCNLGYEVVTVRDPGGAAISEQIRSILLDPANSAMSKDCELLLYEAARSQLVREIIEPAIVRGAVVLSDRFIDSTWAYQAYARGISQQTVQTANMLGSCGVIPDKTLVIDIDPALALVRRKGRTNDRIEAEGLTFQQKIRAGYLALADAEKNRVSIIDGTGLAEEVQTRVYRAVKELLLFSDSMEPPDE